jgi:hypothetical protein
MSYGKRLGQEIDDLEEVAQKKQKDMARAPPRVLTQERLWSESRNLGGVARNGKGASHGTEGRSQPLERERKRRRKLLSLAHYYSAREKLDRVLTLSCSTLSRALQNAPTHLPQSAVMVLMRKMLFRERKAAWRRDPG